MLEGSVVMNKRNFFSIGFLMLSTTVFLTYYRWGATESSVQEVQALSEAKDDSLNQVNCQDVGEKEENSNQSISNEAKEDVQDNLEDTTTSDGADIENDLQSVTVSNELDEQAQDESNDTQNEEQNESQVFVQREGTVKTGGLYVRKTPKKDGQVIDILEKGQSVIIEDETEDGWYSITYSDKTGYVYSEYVTTSME